MDAVRTEVGAPIPATAVVVDLRGFTAELSRSREDDGSRARFCGFLAEMNAAVVLTAALALQPGLRGNTHQHVHIGATGDGALLVFTHPDHVRHATIAALLLRRQLESDCRRYDIAGGWRMDFGIGIETGEVRPVGAWGPQVLATYIGGCINMAARMQALTKSIDRTHIVFGASIIDGLLRRFFAEEKHELGTEIRSGSASDEAYLAYERRRIALNRKLCVTFLHVHRMRGIDRPMQLYRLSKSSAVLGNPRFERLLARLVGGDESWLEEIRTALD